MLVCNCAYAETKEQAADEHEKGKAGSADADGELQPEPHATLWRMGRHVDLCASELVANTALVGRFSVTAVQDLCRPLPLTAPAAKQSKQQQLKTPQKTAGANIGAGEGIGAAPGGMRLFRAQGVAVPTEFLVHHSTFEVLRARAARPNTRLPLPSALPIGSSN